LTATSGAPVLHEERIRHGVERVAQEVARALQLGMGPDALQLRARARGEGAQQREVHLPASSSWSCRMASTPMTSPLVLRSAAPR
jgi:hypothetical protein